MMKQEIKRATGLLVIEVVNSNPNGDPDRESDPRQRSNGCGEISPVSFKRKLRDLLDDQNAAFFQTLPEKYRENAEIKLKNKIDKVEKEYNTKVFELETNAKKEILKEKEKLQERLAKIAGGVAVIQVGAATEIEMKDKKLRIEDALSATKAAVEEGIVAGGGTAYANVVPKVEKLASTLEEDEKLGAKIVLNALEEPIKQIARNAGLEPAVILEKVKNSEKGIGFDASTEKYVDMKKEGIVDPTKVTRSAIQNASSVASMILTTESLVTEKKEPKECGCGSHEEAPMGGMY